MRDTHDNITLTSYWSRTYDVLAIVGDEEDAKVEVIASFDTRDNAMSFIENTEDGRYVVGVRPPASIVKEAVAWLSLLANDHIESMPTGAR